MSTEQQNQTNPTQHVTPPGTEAQQQPEKQPEIITNVTVDHTANPLQTPSATTTPVHRSPQQLSPREDNKKDDANIELDTLKQNPNPLLTDSIDNLLTPTQPQQTTPQSLSINPQQKTSTDSVFGNDDFNLFDDDSQEQKKEKKQLKQQNLEQQQYRQPGFDDPRSQGQYQFGGDRRHATRSNTLVAEEDFNLLSLQLVRLQQEIDLKTNTKV